MLEGIADGGKALSAFRFAFELPIENGIAASVPAQRVATDSRNPFVAGDNVRASAWERQLRA